MKNAILVQACLRPECMKRTIEWIRAVTQDPVLVVDDTPPEMYGAFWGETFMLQLYGWAADRNVEVFNVWENPIKDSLFRPGQGSGRRAGLRILRERGYHTAVVTDDDHFPVGGVWDYEAVLRQAELCDKLAVAENRGVMVGLSMLGRASCLMHFPPPGEWKQRGLQRFRVGPGEIFPTHYSVTYYVISLRHVRPFADEIFIPVYGCMDHWLSMAMMNMMGGLVFQTGEAPVSNEHLLPENKIARSYWQARRRGETRAWTAIVDYTYGIFTRVTGFNREAWNAEGGNRRLAEGDRALVACGRRGRGDGAGDPRLDAEPSRVWVAGHEPPRVAARPLNPDAGRATARRAARRDRAGASS